MPTKRQVLDVLSRDELARLVQQHGVIVGGRVRAHLADRLEEKGPALPELLAGLSRERLKELCRALGLDDGGREKAALVERLAGEASTHATQAATQLALPLATPAAPPKAAARRSSSPPAATPAGAAAAPTTAEAITLSQLESHLWEAANILRGSPVDRTDWKSYILPLLFFKRVCDVWDEEHEKMLAELGADYPDEHRFQIPPKCHWRDVRGAAKNVGTALQNAMRGLEIENQKHLYGVFGDAQWSNKERLPDELLKDLVEHFSMLPLGNARVASDVMGDAYEYLIKQFADATNKKAGEFYTPRSVVRLMVDMLDPKPGETIYDPACGTGGMLLVVVAHVREAGGDPRTFFGKLFAQEKNLSGTDKLCGVSKTYAIAP